MRRTFGMALIRAFAAFLSACNVKQIAAGYVGRVLTPTGWEDRIYEAGQVDLGTKHFSGTYNTLVLLEASSTTVKEQFTSAAILTDPNCRQGRGIPLFQILGPFGSLLKLVRSSNAMATHQIWFITGSSRGFGWALASAVLEAGDSVVATARRPEQLTLRVCKGGIDRSA